MDKILEFIKPELLILIPVIYFIGIAIKKSNTPDKFIPLTLGFISIVLCGTWVLSTSTLAVWQDGLMAAFVAVTQGVLIAGTSVYVNQLIKQSTKTEDKE